MQNPENEKPELGGICFSRIPLMVSCEPVAAPTPADTPSGVSALCDRTAHNVLPRRCARRRTLDARGAGGACTGLHGTPNPAHHPMAGTPHDRSAIMGPSCWTARTACISVVVSQLYLTGMLPGGDSAVKERQQPCARATPVLSNSSVLIITECEALWRRVVTHRRLHCLPGLTDDLFWHDECVGGGYVERRLREYLETGHGHATRLWACRTD